MAGAAALSGAVQINLSPLASSLGAPFVAVHFPGALPIKVTSSPTPTSVRFLAVPSGAEKVVSWVIVGLVDFFASSGMGLGFDSGFGAAGSGFASGLGAAASGFGGF